MNFTPPCASELRHLVTFQRPVEGDTVTGQAVEYVDDGTAYCRITPQSGEKRLRMQQLGQKTTHDVVTRWRDKWTERHRIIYNGRQLGIVSIIDPTELRQWLAITCAEGPGY